MRHTGSDRRPWRRIPSRARLGALASCVFFVACKVVIVSGPTEVAVGDTVTYVLEVSTDQVGLSGFYTIAAEVPAGWELLSSTYQGTVFGEPVAGNAVLGAFPVCSSAIGATRPGYQTLYLSNETLLAPDTTDTGQVTLQFRVDDQPDGELEIFFVFGEENCSLPAVVTLNRQGGKFLELVQSLFDDTAGIDGISGPGDVRPSPDGRHLYAAAGIDQSVVAFLRGPSSGALSLIEIESQGVGGVTGLGIPRGLAMSPEGDFLYVASLPNFVTAEQGGVAIFSRDPATGQITFVERLFEAVEHLAMSPDGQHLYAADEGITVYSRSMANGALSYVETVFPGGTLTMSTDGRHIYAGSADGLFVRDESTGRLSFESSGGFGTAPSLSPDGRYLYSLRNSGFSGLPDEIWIFERNAATGLLTFQELFSDLSGESIALGAESMAISPDGSHLVVAGRVGLFVLERNNSTGGLTQVESYFVGNLPVDDFEGPRALTFAPDGRHLFAASLAEDALLVFETAIVFFDGFESGTTSAWSSTVP